jgi:taurine dioxygenase
MTTTTASLDVQRQTGSLGAIVTGVDLSKPISDETFAALQAAFLTHQMICIRGQSGMSMQDQLEFSQRWGDISVHPYVPSIEGFPGLMKIYDPNPVTQTWHSDTTHAAKPPAITLLLARIIPPFGGDTMWSNAYQVYEELSPGMREMLDGLRAVHRGTELAASAGLDAEAVKSVHPVIRTHPQTGRRALYVNGNYTKHFDGWSVAESEPLLHYLYAQVGRPEYVYRHKWRVGDLVMWDNRCTQHSVIADTHGAERVLHRVTIEGDVPA